LIEHASLYGAIIAYHKVTNTNTKGEGTMENILAICLTGRGIFGGMLFIGNDMPPHALGVILYATK
jgi:hypothetical protein